MTAKRWMMLQTFLNRYHKGSSQPLLQFLPKEEAEALAQQSVETQEVGLAITQPSEIIQKIHYSWLAAPFEKLEEPLKPFVLAALPATQGEGLAKMLNITPPRMKLATPFKALFLDLFLVQMGHKEHLPAQFLPSGRLNALLELSKPHLVELIDFLGLQDLAEELRHIVDKQKLKRIYLCLSPKKQKYLKACMHQKEKVPSTPLGLEKWDGSPQKLENALHRRGLARLGMALSGQNGELVWHLTRQLDSGRGQILEKNVSAKEVPHLTQVMTMQVLNLIKFLKQG